MIRFEELLARSARHDPQRSAVINGRRRLSYADFDAAADRFAAGLLGELQFRRGERCVLFIDNRIEAAIGIFGTLRAGGVFSVLNPSTKADKLAKHARKPAFQKLAAAYGLDHEPVPFSSVTGEGRDKVWDYIEAACS